MKTQEISITKDLAAFWLTKNDQNRKLVAYRVLDYARQMNDGLWLEAGDPIRFQGEYERLLDGQHRLSAFIKSNLDYIKMNVITGLSADAFMVIDQGAKRSYGDILQINGYKNSNILSGAIKAIISINNGLVAYTKEGNKLGINGKAKSSAQEVMRFAEDNPQIHDIVPLAHAYNRAFPAMTVNELTAYYFLFSQKDEQMAKDFFDQLSSGLNLKENSPIYHLRKKLEQDKMSGVKMVGKMRQAIIITCWNHFRKGAEMRLLRFYYDSEIPNII